MIRDYIYKPGDYTLDGVVISGVTGRQIDVTDQVLELIIYEDIESSSITGSLLIDDSSGIYQSLPIIGQEKIIFKVTTPGYALSIDFTTFFANVYDVEKRITSGEHSHTYLLNWTTDEALLNVRTRVSKSYKGEFSTHVEQILRDERYLNSRKRLFVEPTKNTRTYVVPNLRPFRTIRNMAEESISKEDEHSYYLFFETTQGYHYRSFDSLLGRAKASTVSPTTKVYRLQPVEPNDPIGKRMTQILEFEVLDSSDTLTNGSNGMFSSTLLQHDIYNKQLNKYEYNFSDNYSKTVRTNSHLNKSGPLISETNMENKDKKKIFDYPSSRLFVHSSGSSNLHTGGTVDNNAKQWLQSSVSRYFEQDFFQVQFLTYGDTSVNVGDVIDLRIPSNRPLSTSEGSSVFDPILSGRYVITNIKHTIAHRDSAHGMTIRCVKDSVTNAFGSTKITYPDISSRGTITIGDSDYKTPNDVISEQNAL